MKFPLYVKYYILNISRPFKEVNIKSNFLTTIHYEPEDVLAVRFGENLIMKIPFWSIVKKENTFYPLEYYSTTTEFNANYFKKLKL